MTKFKGVALAASALALSMATSAMAASSFVAQGFQGATLVQNQTVGGGFIPPDTMGAVGTTQYVEIINGSYSVYSKATGTQLSFIDDDAFWSAAGATDFNGATAGGFTNGDPRIMFDASRNRWIASAFGGDTSYLNIAVSDTADALGPWKATTFLAFNGVAGAGVADYQTLAMDRNAVYIGQNNFDTAGFIGTTLNVIPIGDIFGAVAPNVANRAVFSQLASAATTANDRGFAIQAVNSNAVGTTGKVVADGVTSNYGVGYDITNAGGGNGVAAQGAVNALAIQTFNNNNTIANGKARQPDGSRTLDTLDTRISSSAFEQNGKIYFTRTVTPNGTDFTASRITVLSATDFSVLQEIDITGGNYDYYQSSLAISAFGVVVGYNRSSFDAATGNVAFMANAYTLDANGLLVFDATHMLKYSTNNGYSLVGNGRNRWGDYASVTVDPTDASKFWAIGEFANFRDTANTLDGWGTWIGVVQFAQAVPEPATWAQMLVGFGLVGGAMRRKRITKVTYSVA
jgi:PEP-CTERM motif